MAINASANGKPETSAVGSLYRSFIETTNSSVEPACPLAKEMANCRPAARQVKNVAAKSRIASHNRFGFGNGATCQFGIALRLSGAARFPSVVWEENPFSLVTGIGCFSE